MLRFWHVLLIIKLTLSGAAYAEQPTPPGLIKQCAEKYLTAKAANMIGSISEGDFLKVCTVTADAVAPDWGPDHRKLVVCVPYQAVRVKE